ncbi:trafficking protein particle complex subunit 13-like isoform X2 [Acanthaster planci]|uniref:Trafficking protein particle complex subunit 13-like isoform X2 n=1 Tax=Acanthaster planci TaxID=133434 RepID=A0A8B7Z7Y4_ACAPL|nr:trafficking protein particle complex subunit 13-like isoform X2 [Acanthaster planci]
MEAPREKEHLLSLKVMRLTKSSFITTTPVLFEARDIAGGSAGGTLSDISPGLGLPSGLECFGVGELLMLPQNFGSIYLGETFSCYVSVHNDSSQVVKDILLKTDLQTSSQRLTLSGSGTPPHGELTPSQCIDEVIHHEVKELGTHILVCAVSYTTQAGENMYFRKFFKFQVLKPLDVKTKFYNAEDYVSDEVYLEAQIQNITQSPMVMERVLLEPTAEYTVRELNVIEPDNKSSETTFGSFSYLNPLDTRQYLYCLNTKPLPGSDKPAVIKGVSNIGKLDIVWKTSMGERGRLQTSQLQRMAPGYGDVKLNVTRVPDSITIEKPFQIQCRITSCCERTMDLKLVLNNTENGLMWLGVSGQQLGKLGPGASMDIELTLLATVPGLQSVSGLRLTDTYLKRTYEHDDVAQIFVYSEQLVGA